MLAMILVALLQGAAAARDPVTLGEHKGRVERLAFSPQGDLVAGLSIGEVALWRVNAASEADRLVRRIDIGEKDGQFWFCPLVFSPKADVIGVGFIRENPRLVGVNLWDVGGKGIRATYDRKPVITNHVYFAFAPNGEEIAFALGNTLEVWTRDTGKTRQCSTKPDEEADIQFMRYTDDGKTLITARKDGQIRFWDAQSGALKRTVQVSTAGVYEYSSRGIGGDAELHSVLVSSDGTKAAAIRRVPNYEVCLWNLENGKLLNTLAKAPPRWSISALAWSHDGKWLAWNRDKLFTPPHELSIVIWNVESGKEAIRLKPPPKLGFGPTFDFSPDSRYFAVSAPTTKNILLWDLSDITKAKDKPKAKKSAK
jgi:WD40 repeat protein